MCIATRLINLSCTPLHTLDSRTLFWLFLLLVFVDGQYLPGLD